MNQEYPILAKFVQRVQRRVYVRQLLQGGILLSTVLLAVLLLGSGIQPLIPRFPLAAPVYSALTLFVLLFLGLYVVVPALRPVLQRRVLTDIEHTYPDLHDDLTNAIELEPEALQRSNPRGVSLELVQALHQHTARKLAGCRPRTVVRQQRLLGLSWSGVLLLATVGVMLLQPHMLSESLRLMTQPLSYLPPRQVHIAITPERVTMARGTNLAVRAQASGRLPSAMQIRVTRPGQQDKTHPMEAVEAGEFRYTFLRPQTSFTFHATVGAFTSPPGSVAIVPSPAIGKMTLHYLFPDYTGLARRTQEGGGNIQALPGTQVQMRLQANVPLNTGVLQFDDGSERPLNVADNTLEGEILVMKAGTYVVAVQDRHGLKNRQPPRYTVQVIDDRLPTVTVLQPQDGLEVDETTALRIRYRAEDDFGLQDAALVYFGDAATPQRIPLRQGHLAQHRWQETVTWDMGQWPLPAGDTVQFYLEVYDNDTISGPKKGVSQTLTLKVRNREQEHEELQRVQADIADALLDLLGDHLELAEQFQEWREPSANDAPLSQEALQQTQAWQRQSMSRAEQLGDRLQEALEQLQHDPYSTYETFADMQALQRNLTHLNRSLLPPLQQSLQSLSPQPGAAPTSGPTPRPLRGHPSEEGKGTPPKSGLAQAEERLEAVVAELERLSSLADHIASGEKFNDLMTIGSKMMEQQNQLLAALDNLPKDFEAGELPPQMRDMLAQLDALMQDLAAAMSQLPTSLTDEFLNQQINALPLADMMQQLQEMQQKLAAGDLEGARRLGESLLKTLSSMVSALQNMRQQARGGPMDAMGQQLQQSSDRLSDLIQRQERVLENTQEIDQKALRQLNQSQQRAFDRLHPALQQDMSQLTKLARELSFLPSHLGRQQAKLAPDFQRAHQQLLKQLQALLKNFAAPDMPQVKQDLEATQSRLTWMQRQMAPWPQPDSAMQQHMAETLAHLQATRQRIDRLPWNRQAMLTPAQRAQLGELGEQQDGVRHDTQELHQAFEDLLPLMPFLPSEMGQNLQEALPFMGQAQSELANRRSQAAIPPEQQALDHLRQAQNSLQQAMQQMAQRGQMMGLSVPMLRQAGRLPNVMPQPGGISQPSRGTAGASVRNFQLPDKEAYKVPRMFREDIVEALKEGYPERYKGLIEQYYRNILR